MQHFVITKNGIARIMHAKDSVTDVANEIAKWHPDDQAQVTSHRSIVKADIPAEFELRDAWEDTGTAIITNIVKARVVRAERIEAARDELAARLMRREFKGDNITTEKAALRAMNVQAEIDAATTPEELNAVWPANLPRP